MATTVFRFFKRRTTGPLIVSSFTQRQSRQIYCADRPSLAAIEINSEIGICLLSLGLLLSLAAFSVTPVRYRALSSARHAAADFAVSVASCSTDALPTTVR